MSTASSPASSKDQALGPPAQLDGGADVLTAVDAVAGGPHDLAHVGPHLVEAGAAEGAAVARAGRPESCRVADCFHRVAMMSGRPILVAHGLELGVHGPGQDVFLALLHAAHAVEAHGVGGVHHLPGVEGLLAIDLVDAAIALDALQAAQTALDLHGGQLGHWSEAWLGGNHLDVIFFAHYKNPARLLAVNPGRGLDLRTRGQAGLLDDIGQKLLGLDSLKVHALDPRQGPNLLYQLDGHLDALRPGGPWPPSCGR